MKSVMCEFEPETLAAALQAQWPERVDADLRAHIAACAICSDVVAVAAAINTARAETRACAVVPDPGLVWWRSQLRARREAAEAAGRPITAAQIVALACVTGLLGACVGATSIWLQSVLGGIASTVTRLKWNALLPPAPTFIGAHEPLVFMLAAVLLLLPGAVVYLAVLRD